MASSSATSAAFEYQAAITHLGSDDVYGELPLRLAGVLQNRLIQTFVELIAGLVDQACQAFGQRQPLAPPPLTALGEPSLKA